MSRAANVDEPAVRVAAPASGAERLELLDALRGFALLGILLWQHARWFLRLLVPAGRMALTNYISDSVVGIAIFYGIGFGLVGRSEPWQFYTIALGMFITQLLFSRWWLARYAQGPMETLWRLGTYGRSGKLEAAIS